MDEWYMKWFSFNSLWYVLWNIFVLLLWTFFAIDAIVDFVSHRPSIFTRLNFTETVFFMICDICIFALMSGLCKFLLWIFLDFCVVAHHLLVWVATVKKINIIIIIIRSNINWCRLIWAALCDTRDSCNELICSVSDLTKIGCWNNREEWRASRLILSGICLRCSD